MIDENIINKMLERYYDGKLSEKDFRDKADKLDKNILIDFILFDA